VSKCVEREVLALNIFRSQVHMAPWCYLNSRIF